MTDLIKHSPNNSILLTASLHVDEARKAISGLVSELLQESRKLNDSSDIELVTLDQPHLGRRFTFPDRRPCCR
jgi:molybdopterin molybdotransferase